MIQEITPHVFHNEYKPQKLSNKSFILYYKGDEVLVKYRDEELSFPNFSELEQNNPSLYKEAVYLFTIDEMSFFLARELEIPAEEAYVWENIKIFRTAKPQYMAYAEIVGHQLHYWYESRRYCGKCGNMMQHHAKERMLYCESCKNMEYPKISPAVIVAVTHGDQILMSKYAGREYTNYALLAGFVEVGETVEETVKREVMEEVGIKVKNITYYKSQPWPLTNSLLLGFFAELDGDGKITLDEEELAMADWFSREEITVKRDDISLTNEMMMLFKEQGSITAEPKGTEIYAHTFGNFEIFVEGKAVDFTLSKSKELLAYLIDRQGAGVTKKEIAAILWEEKEYTRTAQHHIQILITQMLEALRKIGADHIIIRRHNYLAVDISKIRCDYYQFIDGDTKAFRAFSGEYMRNYSWGELTAATLYLQKEHEL